MSLFKILRAARHPINKRLFRDPFYAWDPYDEFFYEDERVRKALEQLEEAYDTMYEPQNLRRRRKRTDQIDEASGIKAEEVAENRAEQKEEKQVLKKTTNWGDYLDRSEATPNKTFERANKIFEEASKSEKPDLVLDENDDLLNEKEKEFGEYLEYFEKKGKDVDFSATKFESSTIFKDGKKVTVTKHSKLQPDGTIKTEVNQEFMDKSGHKDSRKWVKEDSLKKKDEKEQQQKRIEVEEAEENKWVEIFDRL